MTQTVYLYLHTHWDREWYRTFEGYRYRLLEVMDQIFDFLDRFPDTSFLLDGQTVLIEDYLAVKPEHKERLQSLVASGRMSVGPWYVLPDEFLVSGEALIRNLQLGISQAKEMGQTAFFGYLPDMFGHIAQMPQILKQSHLEPAFLWRGVNPRHNIFDWQSLNGHSLVAVHLTKGYYQDAFHDPAHFSEKMEPFFKGILEATPKNAPVLLPVGGDHLGLPENLFPLLEDMQESYTSLAFEVSSLNQYVEAMKSHGFHKETIQGELRNCESSYVLPGVLSTRVYLKQKNARLQSLLEKQIEPLLAWVWLSQKKHPDAMLSQAWKYLIQNQPHDSICGCSIDEVHQDMMPRFRWVDTLIKEMLQSASVQAFGQSLTGEKGAYLHCLNMSPNPWTGAHKAFVEFPQEAEVASFTLEDPDSGEPIVFEVLHVTEEEKFVSEPTILPHWEAVKRFHCLIPLELSPFSIRSLKITPQTQPVQIQRKPPAHESFTLENEHCKVIMDTQKGRLKIYRREEGLTWVKCLRGPIFFDEGDAGDTYNYSPPIHDQKIEIPFQEAKLEKTALSQRLLLTYHGSLPAQLNQERQKRSKVNVPCRIHTVVELRENDPTIYFKTRLNNQARDHRLKMLFQSMHPPVRCWGSTPFGAIERETPPPRAVDVPKGKERPADTFPVFDWVHLGASQDNGFTFVGQGLHECGFQEWQGKPTLSVTLLRGVGWLSRDDLRTRGGGAGPRMKTPEAQCLGYQEFEYSLSLVGNERKEALKHIHQQRNVPLLIQGGEFNVLPQLFEMTPSTVTVTALKKARDSNALILRCVNLNDSPVKFVLRPHFDCQEIYMSNPLEESLEAIPFTDPKIQKVCQPYEVMTFKFIPSFKTQGAS